MDNMPKNVVTKENFDKVDLLLDQLESKAEAIISD
jgi:tetrahydromethanopterin S-methyltransferase subunit G